MNNIEINFEYLILWSFFVKYFNTSIPFQIFLKSYFYELYRTFNCWRSCWNCECLSLLALNHSSQTSYDRIILAVTASKSVPAFREVASSSYAGTKLYCLPNRWYISNIIVVRIRTLEVFHIFVLSSTIHHWKLWLVYVILFVIFQ